MLRTSPILGALVSKTKQQILAATLLQPERAWYLGEMARHLRLRPSSLQRELGLLTKAGILLRRQNGNRVYFQADKACPVFSELAQILFKTVGVVEVIRKALEPLHEQIDVAFIYGSVADSTDHSTSDIDLMIIGALSLSRLAPLLRDLERQVGRPVNPTIYGRDEFIRRVQDENHFLKSVLQSEPLFVKGESHDLAELTASAESKKSPHQPARARRPARRR